MITTSADSTTARSYAWPVKDKVALVTGAGRGIGRATALALAERGARVLAVSRTEAELVALARRLPLEYVAETVATAEGCERIVAEARRRLGPIDILVNNAGIGSAKERAIWEQDPDAWRETLAVNLDGPFHLTRLAATDMVERGWGRIVMVSSTAGELGGPAMSAYCASKHGVIGLMRAVAQDVGRFDVTCNAVLPGWVRTEMAERSAAREAERRGITVDEVWRERAAVYPPGRVVAPEEVAATIAFLASEEASGINGEALTVSLGGLW
jgi:NAD(P)-dependent dehydrogenase (short-subunit alcohol dehydrogenase family)